METPACLACTAPNLTLVRKGLLLCLYCGSSFSGLPLVCPSCGWINIDNLDRCPDCGEPLNVIAQVISRQDTAGGPIWLQRVQSQANELKQTEERASQDRLQKLQMIDRKREEAVAREKAQRSKDDRLFSIILGAGVILLILILAVLAYVLG